MDEPAREESREAPARIWSHAFNSHVGEKAKFEQENMKKQDEKEVEITKYSESTCGFKFFAHLAA